MSSSIINPIKTANATDSAEKDINKIKKKLVKQGKHLARGIFKSYWKWKCTATNIIYNIISHFTYKIGEISLKITLPPTSTIVDLQLNFMVTTVEYTEYMNTCQVTVGVIDQPLYTIKKTIQLKHANKFNQIFCFMGCL